MSKRAYTQFHPPLLHDLKVHGIRRAPGKDERGDALFQDVETGRYLSSDEVYEYCKNSIRDPENNYLLLMEQLDLFVINGRSVHLFMPSEEFCEWLVSCVDEFNRDHLGMVADLVKPEIGCIHLPTSMRRPSFSFASLGELRVYVKTDGSLEEKHVPRNGLLIMSFSSSNNAKLLNNSMIVSDRDINSYGEQSWYAKLVVGLGMYLACFPEQLKEGLPEDLKHPSHFKYPKARTVGVSEKIVSHAGPTPHYRVGHFRLLKADRYKKKRGQVVFVRGTFVKGRAETVEGIE